MLKHIALVEGTRAEILEELETLGKDASQAGKDEKAREFARAIRLIGEGETLVEVRRARYQIIE